MKDSSSIWTVFNQKSGRYTQGKWSFGTRIRWSRSRKTGGRYTEGHLIEKNDRRATGWS